MNRVALIVLLCLPLSPALHAQQKSATAVSSQLCNRENAVDIAKQQIAQARTLDDVVQRIAVLIRAGDLLWPYEQEKALAAFLEAFDLAVQHFKEHGDEIKLCREADAC